MRRLRVLHLVVQPVLVWDDGESLAPGPEAQPVMVPLSELDDFPAAFRSQFADFKARAEGPPVEVGETAEAPA